MPNCLLASLVFGTCSLENWASAQLPECERYIMHLCLQSLNLASQWPLCLSATTTLLLVYVHVGLLTEEWIQADCWAFIPPCAHRTCLRQPPADGEGSRQNHRWRSQRQQFLVHQREERHHQKYRCNDAHLLNITSCHPFLWVTEYIKMPQIVCCFVTALYWYNSDPISYNTLTYKEIQFQ